MNDFSRLPRGFLFKPTDEELIEYYLKYKIASKRMDLDIIEVDLNEIEPWNLPESCKIGNDDDKLYVFSRREKCSTGMSHTNRATKAGYWRAEISTTLYSESEHNRIIGTKEALIFFNGRAPNGQRSDWVMHEYSSETNENGTTLQEEGWVLCKIFKESNSVSSSSHSQITRETIREEQQRY